MRDEMKNDMKIGIVDVFVDDQDRARGFYTEVLGMELKVDAAYGPDTRWLTVVSPQDRGGTQLMLAPMDDAAAALQAKRRAAGTPAVSFTTDDCDRRYDQMRSRGVVFVSEPKAMGYGGVDAVFEDGCGNLLNLHQDAPAPHHTPGLEVAGVLAALAVSDMDTSVAWTTRLLGRPADARPMDTLTDWDLGPQGALQLVLDPDRAGGSLVTLHVPDIAAARAQLADRSIALDYDDTTSTKVKFGQVSDPDGNSITLVEPFGELNS